MAGLGVFMVAHTIARSGSCRPSDGAVQFVRAVGRITVPVERVPGVDPVTVITIAAEDNRGIAGEDAMKTFGFALLTFVLFRPDVEAAPLTPEQRERVVFQSLMMSP